MPFMPFHILGVWFRGVLAIAILAGGVYLLRKWRDDSQVLVPVERPFVVDAPREERKAGVERRRSVFRFDPGWNRQTGELAAAIALLAWATMGRLIGNGLWMMTLRRGVPADLPPGARESEKTRRLKSRMKPSATSTEADEDPNCRRCGEVHRIRRPNGTELRIESYGPPDAPPIIWTHGWGTNGTLWFYQKRNLADRFRLIVWDEPGLGLSRKPDDNDYRLETMRRTSKPFWPSVAVPPFSWGTASGG